ncbi:MAG: AraC family transcriptional regulator [Nevskiales bacterium]|nr:AraC family transcriptional regulator [Nevskiales bacterium]
MTSRSILGLMYTLQGLRRLGEDPAPVLAHYGLDLDTLDPSTRIDRALELRIYVEIAESLRDPLAGLRSGEFTGFAGYGPFTMLLMTCASAQQAIEVGVRYQQLTFLFSTLSFERGEPASALTLVPLPLPDKAFRFRIDGEVSGTYKLLRDLQATLGVDLNAEGVDLPYPRPPEADAYARHFGCPVRFDQPVARIWIRNLHLTLRFPTHDPAAHALYRDLCDRQLAQQQAELRNLSEQVLRHLQLFRNHFPQAAQVAQMFGLSERSLRRRLGDEGTHFRDLLARARFARASELLTQSDLSVEAIAEQLGYAEPAAFIHAFQRWADTTPLAFRNARRG